MSRKISVVDLSRYVNAAHDLAQLVAEAIKEDDAGVNEDLVLALNEFALAADAIADLTSTLQLEKIKLN